MILSWVCDPKKGWVPSIALKSKCEWRVFSISKGVQHLARSGHKMRWVEAGNSKEQIVWSSLCWALPQTFSKGGFERPSTHTAHWLVLSSLFCSRTVSKGSLLRALERLQLCVDRETHSSLQPMSVQYIHKILQIAFNLFWRTLLRQTTASVLTKQNFLLPPYQKYRLREVTELLFPLAFV